jgi:subtilisin-like proprotein convertase family protein
MWDLESSVKKSFVAAAAFAALAFGGSAQAATVFNGAGGALPDRVNFTSTITVGQGFSVSDVNVGLSQLFHTYWADLDISLTHNGVTVFLTDENGGSADAFGDYGFDDAAVTSVGSIGAGPGTYSPLQALAAFNGMSAAGDWVLRIYDDAGADAGNLGGWSLSLTGSAVPEPATWAMMIIGFGAAGSMVRASRRRGVAAAA